MSELPAIGTKQDFEALLNGISVVIKRQNQIYLTNAEGLKGKRDRNHRKLITDLQDLNDRVGHDIWVFFGTAPNSVYSDPWKYRMDQFTALVARCVPFQNNTLEQRVH